MGRLRILVEGLEDIVSIRIWHSPNPNAEIQKYLSLTTVSKQWGPICLGHIQIPSGYQLQTYGIGYKIT